MRIASCGDYEAKPPGSVEGASIGRSGLRTKNGDGGQSGLRTRAGGEQGSPEGEALWRGSGPARGPAAGGPGAPGPGVGRGRATLRGGVAGRGGDFVEPRVLLDGAGEAVHAGINSAQADTVAGGVGVEVGQGAGFAALAISRTARQRS